MGAINYSVIQGRFTANPELKVTPNGTNVTNFTLAVDRKYQPQGAEKVTNFIDFVAWGGTAEFITKYFQKGSLIVVEGEIQTRSFEDKDGNKRKATEINVSNASFCSPKATTQEQPSSEPSTPYDNSVTYEEMSSDDDLPF